MDSLTINKIEKRFEGLTGIYEGILKTLEKKEPYKLAFLAEQGLILDDYRNMTFEQRQEIDIAWRESIHYKQLQELK